MCRWLERQPLGKGINKSSATRRATRVQEGTRPRKTKIDLETIDPSVGGFGKGKGEREGKNRFMLQL